MFRRTLIAVSLGGAIACAHTVPALAQDTVRVAPITLHGFVYVTYRAGDPLTMDGYRLRKADIKFAGEVAPSLKWRISFDAAKAITLNKTTSEIGDSTALSDAAIDQRSRMLQDAALTYGVNKYLSFDIGQQIIPLGLEGTYATAQIETVERTLFVNERSRAVGLGDVRDIGVSANGVVADGNVEYHLGVFNETGEGAGTLDVNQQKAIVGRVAFHPAFFPAVQFGGSGGFEGGSATQRRERAAGEIQYRDRWVTLRAEVMSARDGLLHRLGWYSLGAYRPNPRLQLTGRYDWWDRDRGAEVSVANALEKQIVVGASYLLEGSVCRVNVNLVRQTFPNVDNVRSGTLVLAGFSGLW
ncbi:MAG TPA: porin [Gemmatimonadaceae bacterium]